MPGLVGRDFMFVFYHIYPLDLMDIYLDVSEPCCRNRCFVHLVTLLLRRQKILIDIISLYFYSGINRFAQTPYDRNSRIQL